MSWSDEDDLFENGKSKKIHRKPRKHFYSPEEEGVAAGEDDADYKRKRSGKRSHRQKTHKDDFWEDNQR